MPLRSVRTTLAAFVLVALAPVATAATQDEEAAVRAADAAFWKAYNACDLPAAGKLLSADVEFYHDRTGLTRTRDGLIESLRKGPCADPNMRLRREAIDTSLAFHLPAAALHCYPASIAFTCSGPARQSRWMARHPSLPCGSPMAGNGACIACSATHMARHRTCRQRALSPSPLRRWRATPASIGPHASAASWSWPMGTICGSPPAALSPPCIQNRPPASSRWNATCTLTSKPMPPAQSSRWLPTSTARSATVQCASPSSSRGGAATPRSGNPTHSAHPHHDHSAAPATAGHGSLRAPSLHV